MFHRRFSLTSNDYCDSEKFSESYVVLNWRVCGVWTFWWKFVESWMKDDGTASVLEWKTDQFSSRQTNVSSTVTDREPFARAVCGSTILAIVWWPSMMTRNYRKGVRNMIRWNRFCASWRWSTISLSVLLKTFRTTKTFPNTSHRDRCVDGGQWPLADIQGHKWEGLGTGIPTVMQPSLSFIESICNISWFNIQSIGQQFSWVNFDVLFCTF